MTASSPALDTAPPAEVAHAPANAEETRDPTPTELDRCLDELADRARSFARMSVREKAALLREILPRVESQGRRMVEASCRAKGIHPESALAGEEWFAGPCTIINNVASLLEALDDIAKSGAPKLRSIRERADGRIDVRVFPTRGSDSALLGGFSCDVRLQAGVKKADVRAEQAAFYKQSEPEGSVSLVLGAGNVASIAPMDALYSLFVDGRVVMLKLSPVNEYLGPILQEMLAPLVSRGFLRIVRGGPQVGAYLAAHASVGHVHITGSQRTHDIIVWGPEGPEQARRRAENDPVLKKPITSELGNVSPVIVVPYWYAADELWYQARSVATQIVNNASFNCNAAKMLVLPRGWGQRDVFLAKLKRALYEARTRKAYYPGAQQRYEALTSGRTGVSRLGRVEEGDLPWTLVEGLDADSASESLFSTEPFCSIVSEVSVGSTDPVEFLDAATRFCNERLWGTLSASLVCHDALAEDPTTGRAFEAALDKLEYGAIAVNQWPAFVYGTVTAPWGGHPRCTLADVQSGIGFVHNTVMLGRIEKAILRGPLRSFPRPPLFYDHRKMALVGERLAHYYASPGWARLPPVAMAAIRG